MIKDPKMSSIVLDPHIKRNIKMKTVSDALTKAKASPITLNLMSEWTQTGLNLPIITKSIAILA